MAPVIRTVLGDIDPERLGKTLTHEHLSSDLNCIFLPPPAERNSELEWSLRNSGWIRQYPFSHKSNLVLNDCAAEKAVVDSVRRFKEAGGGCLVENSTVGLCRNINFVKDVSAKTGVHVVTGTGYYVNVAQNSSTLALSIEEMTAFMRKELVEGCIDNPNVKCGLIGEIGCTDPIHGFERKVIEASANAQKEVGCCVSFHPGRNSKAPFEILRIFQEAGGKAEKAIMSHIDRSIQDSETLFEFSKTGAYCQLDLFGTEISWYQQKPDMDYLSDGQRVNLIKHLLDDGSDRILIAQDICMKNRLEEFGGHGYKHIFETVVPKMKIRGISEETVDKILIENPRTVLAIE